MQESRHKQDIVQKIYPNCIFFKCILLQVLDLKDKIRDAMKKMMEDADWMDETTRNRAIDKVIHISGIHVFYKLNPK